jgi:hypothetical protein
MSHKTHYVNPNKPTHRIHVDAFLSLAKLLDLEYTWPNYEASPWHVQAIIKGNQVNFWPCANKANVNREKAVYGRDEIIKMLQSLEQGTYYEGGEVIDDGV